MTVTSTIAKSGPYDGNGSDTVFDYTFPIDSEDELKITLTDSDGVDTIKTLTTHYSVTIGDDGTGTFTMVTAPATGEQVTATLDIDLTQETDLLNYGAFDAETHEQAWDKLTRICQQQQEEIDRSLKLGQSSDLDPEDVTLANLAEQVIIDTDNFDNILSGADTSIQAAFETLDDGAAPLGVAPVLLDSASANLLDSSIEVASADMANYPHIVLEIDGLVPSAAQELLMRVSNNTGSSWISTNVYDSTGHADSTGSSAHPYTGATWGVANQSSFQLTDDGETPDLLDFAGVHGEVHIYEHDNAYLRFHAELIYGSSVVSISRSIGTIDMNDTFDGVQLFFDSTSIKEGTIRLWGLPKGS